MEGRCLFDDGDLLKPDKEVSAILQSSSLWDLILFKTMIDLKEKQGLINQLLIAIDIIHMNLGSLLHECLIPKDEYIDSDECIVLPLDFARLLGFQEFSKLRVRSEIPNRYANLFKKTRLIERNYPRNPTSRYRLDCSLFASQNLSAAVKVEMEECDSDGHAPEIEDEYTHPSTSKWLAADIKEDSNRKSKKKKRPSDVNGTFHIKRNTSSKGTATAFSEYDSIDIKIESNGSDDEGANGSSKQKKNPSSRLSTKCTKCHKMYSSINNVRRHMKKCLNDDKEKLKVKFPDFVCIFCQSAYSTFIGFRNHVNITCPKKSSEPVGFLCDKCKTFIFKPPGTEHTCEPYFNCDQCSFKCYNENHFRQHYRLVHLNIGTIYCCEVCGKTFDSKTRLGNHLVVHTKERSFLCTECGKGFGRKSVLDVHMSVHFSRNVPCNICGKIFAHSNLVRKHIAAQHPKNGVLTREQCPHCTSSFRSKFYLIKHIKHKHNVVEAQL